MAKLFMKSGVCSLCNDGQHILMFDIDINHLYEGKIVAKLRTLQKKFNLSNIYLFQTRNGWHAWCLDKFDLDEVYKMYLTFPFSDAAHRVIGYYYRKHYVLRTGSDIKLDQTLKQHYTVEQEGRTKSNAHRIFLNYMYNTHIDRDLYFDNSKNVLLEYYPQKPKGHGGE